MAKLTINLPEIDSPDGVTLETLTAYVQARGSQSVEEFVNMCLADCLGFRPKGEQFYQLSQLRNLVKRRSY